jgi:formylglycine-generating enzyme required for sulfatase activity
MGSNPLAVDADEKPARVVKVQPFAIGMYEVTVADYERFARAAGRRMPAGGGANKPAVPVTSVTWEDALAYTQWLSNQTGKAYRLPTEAQWEYAARAGTDTPYWWGRETIGHAHCFGCESGFDPRQPTRIGSFKANAFGLFDTAGNVAEWVHDCYHPSYEGAPADGAVWEGGDCSLRVVRGGSFANASKSIRSAKRDKLRGNTSSDAVGFRVAREP